MTNDEVIELVKDGKHQQDSVVYEEGIYHTLSAQIGGRNYILVKEIKNDE